MRFAPEPSMQHHTSSDRLLFSVCIISNVVNPLFLKVVQSAISLSDDICIGLNAEQNGNLDTSLLDGLPVRIIHTPWQGYGSTKNELANYAYHNWVLSIDSDEVIDKTLEQQLLQLPTNSDKVVYAFKRKNFLGSKHIRFGDYGREGLKPRLYNKLDVQWNNNRVHETLNIPEDFSLKHVPGALLHYSAADKASLIASNTHYARLSAAHKIQEGYQVSPMKIWTAPLMAFLKNYLFKLGFLDGAAGFWLAKEYARYTRLKYDLVLHPEKNPLEEILGNA